ncbi:MAG: pyruvate kinase [Planctomycetaceae bacterium]|nr:pyruvate kinase [Planctomycetaceae bacterium]
MWKRTKIIATLGPASATQDRMEELIHAGVDLFRVNFSHGTQSQHAAALQAVRAAEARVGRPVAVCGDLCGPKIRVGLIGNGEVQLLTGHSLTIQRAPVIGTADRISTTLPELVDMARPGDAILLADGRLRLEVVTTQPPDQITCRIQVGGVLSSGKGVNLPHSQLTISSLTEKDLQDVEFITRHDFDYVALSFVQQASDVRQLRSLLAERHCDAQIVAKIEKPQALSRIDEIIDAADAIMVARGDLGVEMDFPSVPITQKMIAHKCERAGKPCIIATEMLESMITSPRPTRAEVSDVANAVFDRADAVMLSAESAIGSFPVAAVTAMRETVIAADKFQDTCDTPVHLELHQASTTAALAGALGEIMHLQPVAAVAVFTVSGTTARLIAKNRPPCPIVALSASVSTLRRCCLYHGVMPHPVETPRDTVGAVQLATRVCAQLKLAQPGERIIILAGHPFDVPGNTNGLVVVTLE